MNLAPIKVGDIVKVDIKGRIFYAHVTEKIDQKPGRGLRIRPIDNRVTYLSCTSHQVKDHYPHKRVRSRSA